MKPYTPIIGAGAAIVVVVLLAGPILDRLGVGSKAKAVIEGPTWVAAGPVHLHGSKSVGQSFEWKCTGPFVACEGEGDECKCCVIQACAPGTYSVQLTVRQARGSRYSESTATHVVTVGGSPPPGPQPVPPNPGPNPPTPPTPPGPQPVPDGKFGLTKSTYDAVMSKVSTPNRAAEAKMLAGAFKGISAKIAAGAIKSVIEVAQETISATDRLGSSRQAWDGAIQTVRKNLAQVLTTSTPLSEVGAALDAVAAGLEFVQ